MAIISGHLEVDANVDGGWHRHSLKRLAAALIESQLGMVGQGKPKSAERHVFWDNRASREELW